MPNEVGSSLRIPNYISASSPKGLRRLMLLNNLKNGKQYNYFDLQFANGKWFVWYYESEKIDELLTQKESLGDYNGINKK
jgi:hypothetical protein